MHFIIAQFADTDPAIFVVLLILQIFLFFRKRHMTLTIKNDPKVFNMVARDSKKFTRLYNKRTSVERYHGRLDQTLGFENHTIRGIGKMTVMGTLADIIMLAMALVHVHNAQVDYASLLDFHN